MQKMYKGLENKIISLQQRIDELNREKTVLLQKTNEIPELRSKLENMRNLENELKKLRLQLQEEKENVSNLARNLEIERDEKMTLLEDKDRLEQEWNNQKQTWRIENEELKKRVHEMIELAKKEDSIPALRTRQLSDFESNEIHHAYQRAVKDKDFLENENMMLREELQRFTRNRPTHSRNPSNASSLNNDDDGGYSSAKNTLELKRNLSLLPNDSLSNHTEKMSPTRSSDTVLILKYRKMLDEEKDKRMQLEKQMQRLENKSNTTVSNEDAIRASELEMENERLRNEYELLRNSITRGVETQEVQGESKPEANKQKIEEKRKMQRFAEEFLGNRKTNSNKIYLHKILFSLFLLKLLFSFVYS